jgi:Domain of unknown function (DUF4328)
MESNPYQSPAAIDNAPAGVGHAVPFESGHGRAVMTTILLSICMGVVVISAVSDVMQIGLLERIKAGDPGAADEADSNDARQRLVGVSEVLVNIATAVCFLMWVHRARRNLPALGADGLKFTPGWTVGWWFVPLANLWKPFQAMQEVWWGSDPDRDVANVNDWRHNASSGPLGWWWAVWIARNVSAQAINRIYLNAETPQQLIESSYALLVSSGVEVIAAALAIAVVLGIDRRQEQRYEKMCADAHSDIR